jgi:hypothetical protein
MRYLLFGTTILVLAGVSSAQAERARWQGHFFLKSTSGTCDNYDPVGTRGLAFFEPQLAGTDNGPGSSFVLHQDTFAKGYRLASGTGRFDDSFKEVETIYVGTDWGPDDDNTVRVRFTSQKPAVIKRSTNFVTIVAAIQNFDFMAGCTTFVHMALLKRPD